MWNFLSPPPGKEEEIKSDPSVLAGAIAETKNNGADPDISIVGYSLRAPKCSSVVEFAKALRVGEDLTTAKTRYPEGHLGLPPRQGRIEDSNFATFDAGFFGLSYKQAEAMDPQIRMLLEVSYESLLDANLSIDEIRGSNTGVYVGHCFSDDVSHKTSSFNPNKNGYELVNGTNSMAANRLSYFYDFKGPSFVIDTACSSSLVALHYATRDLANGSIDRAIVSGLSLTLNPHKNASFAAFKMLSPTGHCYTFDERANGYCRADAVVCIVLERSCDGYAMVAGTGTNSDGRKTEGITYPSADQQAALMKQVFAEKPWLNSKDVGYHEAHGTGTVVGDREELKALSQVYQHPMVVGSVKSNMGHAEGASGLMGLVKILLMIEDGELYPNWDFRKSPHPYINEGAFSVLKRARTWEPTACSISSFGFGGSNAFAVLVPCQTRKQPKIASKTLSPESTPFSSSVSCPIPSLTSAPFYSLQRSLGNHLPFKCVWDGSKWQEHSPLVFVLDGQGSQWEGMGSDLVKSNPTFRSTMEKLQDGTGIPLVDLYTDGSKWMSKEYSTIGIVSFQIGLLAILRACGIRAPDFYLGHSVGEIACSYLAGFSSEVEVIHFAMVRTKLVSLIDTKMRLDVYDEKPKDGFDYHLNVDSSSRQLFVKRAEKDAPLNPSIIESYFMHGQMVVIGCSADEINTIINELGLKHTRIACYNAKSSHTVSGPSPEVTILSEFIQQKKKQTFIRKIDTDHIAYHATYLEVFYEWLKDEFGLMDSSPIPHAWKSTSRNNMFGTKYLVDNITRPVYFQDAIEKLPKNATVVEIGPANGLLSQIKRIRPDLTRVALVERLKSLNFEQPLQDLMGRYSDAAQGEQDDMDQAISNILHYSVRYPKLWGQDTKLRVMSWNEWELPKGGKSSLITYDLTRKPWNTLKDHVVQEQNLFPATGFIHALWSGASFKSNVEISDFRIHTPLLISSVVEDVRLRLSKAGPRFELWDENEQVRYVSANVETHRSSSPPTRPSMYNEEMDTAIEGKHFYPYIRRLGYQYGPTFQLIDRLSQGKAYLKKNDNLNWISYLDAMLHILLLNETSFAYPVAFDRIYFWESSLSEAPLWVLRQQDIKIENSSVLLEGLRMEYVPVIHKKYSLHNEIFVEYNENDSPVSPDLIASLICRESRKYCVKEPLSSPQLQQVCDALQDLKIMKNDNNATAVVLSDSSDVENAEFLLTTDKHPPKGQWNLIARWANLRAYRLNWSIEKLSSLSIVSDWESAVQKSQSFIWRGVGTSGAAASLAAETNGRIKALSYEGSIHDSLIGLSKGMRHNFVLENGSHGIFVDRPMEGGDHTHSSHHALLRVSRPGHLSSLQWEDLDPSMYSTSVSVATLNFRDVMRAMGKLREKDLSLGLEFSGFDKVKQKRVFGVAKHSLSTDCSPMYSFPIPPDLTDAEAATLPVVYLTAYFALCHKADMKSGQSILIHAGSGGVGIAAIRLALSRGLNVFTTCGSATKRRFIKDNFGIEDKQIGDSRSDSFVETVMRGTNGRGVDIALNQLSGALQIATLRCMAPEGHFCEIGKYDVMQNTGIGQAHLAANISFHVIDLLPLLSDIQNKPLWDHWLSDGFAKKEIVPLPIQEFNVSEVTKAFRFMSQGRHIGKIVIAGLDTKHGFPVISKKLRIQGQVHLIVGGLGGLGLHIASRLATDGCKEVLLVGRKAVPNGFQRNQIAFIRSTGCKVRIVKSNVHELLKKSLPEPDMIWHAATVYRDMFLSEMTEEAWDLVVKTKVEGYNHLRRSWPSCRIVVFSSVAAYFGNALQTSYALANASLDYMARSSTTKTLSIRLGPLDNVGFITKGDNNRILFDQVPFEVMNIDSAIDSIMQITAQHESGVFGVYDLKNTTLVQQGQKARKQKKENTAVDRDLYTADDAKAFISVVLGGTPDNYKTNTSLKAAGLDSLSTMEVVNHIHQESGSYDLKPSDIDDNFTVRSMVEIISSGRHSSASYQSSMRNSSENVKQENGDTETRHTMNNTQLETGKEQKDRSIQALGDEVLRRHMVTIEIAPSSIDFETLISALNSTDIVVLRQKDSIIFNHGAPVDSNDEVSIAKFMDQYVTLAQAFETTTSTVITFIEGEVRGGGMLFPASADICLATSNASFGLPEIHRNMVPSVVSKALIERLGQSITRRLSLTGESFDADNALRLGLVDKIIGSNEADQYIAAMVRRWKSSTAATKFIKRQLLPRESLNASAMGTVAGSWLMEHRGHVHLADHEVLKVMIHNSVATLTMCDTIYQNTMTFEMTSALREAIPQLKREAKVIILASSLSHFHVGLNPAKVREWMNLPTVHVAANMKECYMGFIELAMLGIPIIAVLNGKVYGGGMPIALWCDYRIATADVDMHFGNISRGMSPAGQLSQLLREYLSPTEVMETYLENSHWDCNDLLRLKIVSSVAHDRDQALAQAKNLALFIAQNPSQAVRDTLHLVKLSYAADVADEESWLIAKKITENKELFRQNNASFSFERKRQKVPAAIASNVNRTFQQINRNTTSVGIIAIEAYTPGFAISADTLERNGIHARKKQGQESVAVWDEREDSISMAMTIVAKLLRKHVPDPYLIRRVEVGTESNVDLAKSIKSYLMDLFPAEHVNIEGVDNMNACYGGAAALLNTLSWCRETGGYGIVVATDTADMDLSDSSWRGASAVAMLVGPNPWIEIHPERASCFKNTNDFLKPRYSPQVTPHMQTKASMNYYIEALDICIKTLKNDHSIIAGDLDAFVFHGGLCATFMKLVERHLLQINDQPNKWRKRFDYARFCATHMGGLYTASLFVNLISLLHHDIDVERNQKSSSLDKIGLFAYGSGSTATLMIATIHNSRAHDIDLLDQLEERDFVPFETLVNIIQGHKTQEAPSDLLPRRHGVYYRDISKIKEGSVERVYRQHGDFSNNHTLTYTGKRNGIRKLGYEKSGERSAIFCANSMGRLFAAVSSVAVMTWWIVSLIFLDESDQTRNVLFFGLVTFAGCLLINRTTKLITQRGSGWVFIFTLFSCSSVIFVIYAIIVSISWSKQLTVWRPLFFGSYTFDFVGLILTWNELPPKFRVFYSVHHSLSFICTGIWMALGGVWDKILVIATTIWLTSDIWLYSLTIYRLLSDLSICDRLSPHQSLKFECIVFLAERMHRITAYCFIFVIKDRTNLHYTILGTGLVMDVLDASFEWNNIRSQSARLARSATNPAISDGVAQDEEIHDNGVQRDRVNFEEFDDDDVL